RLPVEERAQATALRDQQHVPHGDPGARGGTVLRDLRHPQTADALPAAQVLRAGDVAPHPRPAYDPEAAQLVRHPHRPLARGPPPPTHSPIWRSVLLPSGATGRLPPSILRTAMSVRGSSPRIFAGKSRPSRAVTTICSAPCVTCWLVITTPSEETMNPDPYPSTVCS